MEFVINEPESDQSIYIEQIDHGKFARISSTSLLLNVGAWRPAVRAGSPVTGSVTSRAGSNWLREVRQACWQKDCRAVGVSAKELEYPQEHHL
jgi:hypothetical protein